MFERTKERVATYLAEAVVSALSKKANPLGSAVLDGAVPGNPLVNLNNPDAILKSLEVEVWAYVAINAVGRSLSEAPLIVERLRSVDSKPTWVSLDSGPLVDLVRMPNEREGMDTLIWRTVMSLCTGDAYLPIDTKSKQLYHVPSDWVKVVPSKDGVEGYEIGNGADRKRFAWDEVVHISMPNPMHTFYGLSPVKPIEKKILLNYYYENYLKQFFKEGAIPSGVLSTEQIMNEEAIKRSKFLWKQAHEGNKDIAVLAQGVTYQQVSPPIDSIVVDTLWKMPREAILAAFGVPPAMAGIFEYANYANADAQVKFFWQNCIMPMQRLIAGALNIQYVPRFGQNIRVRFDTSGVKALQEDDAIKSTKLTKYVAGGIMTANEAREELGLEPLDGGDELRTAPTGGFGQQADQIQDDTGGNAGKMFGEPSPDSAHAIKPNSSRRQIWNLHEKSVLGAERSFKKLMRRYFDDQLDRVLDKLPRLQLGNNLSATLLYCEMNRKADDPDNIFNRQVENQYLREHTEPFTKETVRKAGQKAINQVGIDLTFSLTNPRVLIMLNQFQNRLVKVNDTTYDAIKDILRDAYDGGWSITQVEQAIRDQFSEFSKGRAVRIATTEMNGIVNGGSMLGYRDAGVQKKEWLTAPGAKYPRHEEYDGLDGQVVGIDEPFDVGGHAMMFPGDPSAPVEEVVNCHCTFVAVVE